MSLSVRETFRGYGQEQGYDFLREQDRADRLSRSRDRHRDDEIFVSDGSKSDCGFILDILGHQNKIAITDPVYPVYVDTNVMAGHTGPARRRRAATKASSICRARRRTDFVPRAAERTCGYRLSLFPEQSDRRGGDARATRELGRLRAGTQGDPALFDAAYEGYISDPDDSAFDFRNSRRARMRG